MPPNLECSSLFVGLTTLDMVYLVEHLPDANQKLVALDSMLAAGGPATNAAITFSHLGGQATLMSVIGKHPMHHLILDELTQHQVQLTDLMPHHDAPPSISSILVTQTTGDRSVVSRNAVKLQAAVEQIPDNALQNIDIVLIDGHQMEVGVAIAHQAKQAHIPVVVDGGSWKSGFERVLQYTDYAICSANFFPPGCHQSDEAIAYLRQMVPHLAITNGAQPIRYCSHGKQGHLPVPTVQVVDTLGAGDIFHGAFCYFLAAARQSNVQPTTDSFVIALSQAAQVAACACQSFGTRQWMRSRRGETLHQP
jgi:sugar/nucleoside kinase (ribokinase family)